MTLKTAKKLIGCDVETNLRFKGRTTHRVRQVRQLQFSDVIIAEMEDSTVINVELVTKVKLIK